MDVCNLSYTQPTEYLGATFYKAILPNERAQLLEIALFKSAQK